MRVVLTCWGSFGDLFPTLGLAAALKLRGHQSVIATCPFYRDIVEAEGLEFRGVRPDIDPSDAGLMARVMDPARGAEVIIRELLAPFVRDAYEDLSAAVEDADLLVSHPVTFAAPLVAEARGVPWLSTVLAPMSFFSVHDFPLLPPLPSLMQLARVSPWVARGARRVASSVSHRWTAPIRELRASLGLSPGAEPLLDGQFAPLGTLALFSRVMADPQVDWPPATTATGFVWYERYGAQGDELRRFLDEGDPPIVFTLGTSAVGAPGEFFRESVRAAVEVGRRAVLLVGRHPGNRPSALPDGVLAVDYAPHSALFPRAAAIVHQGGAGTTAQALKSGRPMLVVPHAHDQPDNAARVKRQGVARVLSPGRYRSRRVARHLHALLLDERYTRRAAEVARVVRAESGAEAAADVIERVLDDTHRPPR